MLWYIELKFCIWLCFTVLQIKFECRQFASIFVGVMPLLELRILEIHSFPHFSLTPFNILSWKFVYYFVLLYYRSSLSVVNLRLFWSYTVFCTFLLHALTYWAEILHMTLFYCTTGQLQVSSMGINFCSSNVPFGFRILEIHSFPHFSPAFFDILSWFFSYTGNFVKCTVDQVQVSSLCVCLALRQSIHFLHFPPTCIDNFEFKIWHGFFNVFLLEKYYIIQ